MDSEKPLRALVADHDEAIRSPVCRLLEDLGVQVVEEQNGSRAADRALNDSFDVILLTDRLAILSGQEVTSLLRKEGSTAPVIGMVAKLTDQSRRSLLDTGYSGVLELPIEVEQFQEVITSLLPQLILTPSTPSVFAKIQQDVSEIQAACSARDFSRVSLLVDKLRGAIEIDGVGQLHEPVRRLASHLDPPTRDGEHTASKCPQDAELDEIESTIRELQSLAANLRNSTERVDAVQAKYKLPV